MTDAVDTGLDFFLYNRMADGETYVVDINWALALYHDRRYFSVESHFWQNVNVKYVDVPSQVATYV